MHCNCAEQGRKARFNNLTKTTASRQSGRALEARYFDILRFRVYLRFSHARVLEGVTKSQYPLKAVVFKSEQPCPVTVSLDLDPLLHSGVEQEDIAPCAKGFLKVEGQGPAGAAGPGSEPGSGFRVSGLRFRV